MGRTALVDIENPCRKTCAYASSGLLERTQGKSSRLSPPPLSDHPFCFGCKCFGRDDGVSWRHRGYRSLTIEIAAHSRTINAIDLHPSSMLVRNV